MYASEDTTPYSFQYNLISVTISEMGPYNSGGGTPKEIHANGQGKRLIGALFIKFIEVEGCQGIFSDPNIENMVCTINVYSEAYNVDGNANPRINGAGHISA